MISPIALRLPYAQATPAQRAHALAYLRARLHAHFPTLPEPVFARMLAEFRPALRLTGSQVTMEPQELTQLVQHLAASPELPLLDPPIYGPVALNLAQHLLHVSELAAAVLPELEPRELGCHPRLWRLLRHSAYPHPLAEQVVQAWRWDLPSSPALPWGVPGGGPAPGSPEVTRLLQRLAPATGPDDG